MGGKKKYFGICLVCSSVVLNVCFVVILIVGSKHYSKSKLGWSKIAAKEAEGVAKVPCSGHGRAYLDGLVVDGKPVCECNTCFSGPDCSKLLTNCSADVASGSPLFLEPFWAQQAASSAVLVSGWHRMGYSFSAQSSIAQQLENHIRKIHKVVGNAVTEGRFIVFGVGSTLLINSAIHALNMDNKSSPAGVVASTPSYPAYREQAEFFGYKFLGDASSWKNSSQGNTSVIEFVTSPNNPDGLLMEAVLQGSSVKTISDRAYYWPHFSAIPAPADEDLMLFTLSKFTGHAGSRFGWALVKNETIYQRMMRFSDQISLGISHDTQLLALYQIKVVLDELDKFFEFGHETMRKRWEALSQALSVSKRFSIQKVTPMYCTFYKKVRYPSPAYGWFKCEGDEDEDCLKVLKAGSIIARSGSLFGAGSRYVRLSLIKSQDDFDLMMSRINTLVSRENVSKTI